MIILKPDGSMAYTFANDVPPDCVRVNADSTLYTPPATPPAPAPPTLAEQREQGLEAGAAAARRMTHAAAIATELEIKYGLDFGTKK